MSELMGECRTNLDGRGLCVKPVDHRLVGGGDNAVLGNGSVGLYEWQLVQPLPDVFVGAPLHKDGGGWGVPPDVEIIEMALFDFRGSGFYGQNGCLPLSVGNTFGCKDAAEAVVSGGLANGGAEIHSGLVEEVGTFSVD